MKKRLLLFSTIFLSLFGYSQEASLNNRDYCQKETQTGLMLLTGNNEIDQDFPKGMELLQKLANEGCTDAQMFFRTTELNEATNIDSENGFFDNLSNITNEALLSSSTPCQKDTYTGRMLLTGNDVVVQDIPKGIELLTKLANDGCPEAQMRLGLVYKKGKYIAPNENKAFEYLQKAADQELPRAIAELGVLHQLGIGCTLNYEEALRLFAKAYELGDGMGAYNIGYCHFKGLGSVDQSYAKAIEWFTKSDYPMAQHWLAIFNYFGYGMPVNKEAAYELLITNTGIVNSPTLLEHLEASRENAEGILSDYKNMDVEQETQQINKLFENEDTATEITTDQNQLSSEKLVGNWSGKLVELEWSGERILRDFPASFEITKDIDTEGVNYKAVINENKHNALAILLDESLYFQNFHISLPRLYKDNPAINELDYTILNANFKLKTIDHIRFLVGYIDTKINNWGEPGPPMLLVLTNDKVLTENGVEISKEIVEALLAQQGDNFINLYPNPFQDNLLIQYELEQESTTTVQIYSLDGMFSETIANNAKQQAGKQLFQYNGSNLKAGLYVVRVTAKGVVHTKLIIKE